MNHRFFKLPPPPTLDELRAKWGLTKFQAARVFENHDPGDEAPRPYGRWACGRLDRVTGQHCTNDPGCWGQHSWEPVPPRDPWAGVWVRYERGLT